jgi:hypothetical protein
MFVEREWLAREFKAGKSLEQVGREVGRHATTVGYWARKHGLHPPGAIRYRARGAPDRELLERLVASGVTLREIALELDRSIATVRHWLRRWPIQRPDARRSDVAEDAPHETERRCPRHGVGTFRLDSRRTYRCVRCSTEAVSMRRRRVKRTLVAEAGGCCAACGYDRCVAALQFHHLEPARKQFALSTNGVTRSLARARVEARKCVLLCANCHAEVEAGYRTLEAAA